ncbi:MAG TPA: ferritin-like domain-containing protein [Polyangiaceae bacterium]
MRKSPLLLSILAALPACHSTFEDRGCMNVPAEQTSCPESVEPAQLYLPDRCGDDLEIVEVTNGGTRVDLTTQAGTIQPACCYSVLVEDDQPNGECAIGRPYFDGGASVTAPLRAAEPQPGASASQRAAAWASAGAGEHASIAAFGRLALQLLAHGAPCALLAGVHQAALDEIRHAELCFGLAEGFGGTPVAAGAFPFNGPVDARISLAELAAAAVREGCLAETLGAHLAQAAADAAPEPAVKDALRAIAAEEGTHAVLSFRIVAWALSAGGAEVRRAVERALSEPWPRLDIAELSLRANVDAALLVRAANEGVAEVLAPAVARLLAA